MKSDTKPRPSYSTRKKSFRQRKRPRYDRSRSGGRHRRRSRTRTRSRTPRRPRKRNQGYKKKGGKTKSGEEPAKKDDKSNGESSYTSPATFEEAWAGNFFVAKAISAVEMLGMPVARIPVLHTMALGGRIKHCIEEWERIGISGWVKNVVFVGYKIPLKFVPTQKGYLLIHQFVMVFRYACQFHNLFIFLS